MILVEVTNHIFVKKNFMNHMVRSENKITVLKPGRQYQVTSYVTILKLFYRRFPASSVSDEMIGCVRYE